MPVLLLDRVAPSLTSPLPSAAPRARDVFARRLAALARYRERHGDCLVPNSRGACQGLARWVGRMRRFKSVGRLPGDQVSALNALGFEWNHDEGCWQRMCRHLEEFHAVHAHCLPTPDRDTLRLAHWVYAQRALNRAGRLSAERVARLNQIGFHWSALEARWWMLYREMVARRERLGTCEFTWDDNTPLARWGRVQRRERRRGKLDAARIAALDEIGFVWAPRTAADKWQQRVDEMASFRARHGHTNVPVNYPANRQLGLWVFHQRQFYKKGVITPERIHQLEAAGFNWSVRAQTWEKNFALFKAHVQRHAHARIGREHRRLAAWAYDQRVSRRKGSLAPARIALLDGLKFNWDMRKPGAA